MRAVLLDLDDTLLDNRGAELGMLAELTAAAREELPAMEPEAFAPRWRALREAPYRRVLSGEWDLDTFRAAHLREVLSPWGAPSEALIARAGELRSSLPQRLQLAEGARALLEALRERGLRTGLLTNGPSAFQRDKLARAGIEPLLDAVGVSEELGAAKPDRAAFDGVLELLGVPAAETVMVGDDLHNDVNGALGAGLAGAVWIRVDPRDLRRPPRGVPVVSGPGEVLAHVTPSHV